MADRSAAEIFGDTFRDLSEIPLVSDHVQATAKKLWRRTKNYDFHYCQMELDDCVFDKLGMRAERIKEQAE